MRFLFLGIISMIMASVLIFPIVWHLSIDMEPIASVHWRFAYSLLWTILSLILYLPGYVIGFCLAKCTKWRISVAAIIMIIIIIQFIKNDFYVGYLYPLAIGVVFGGISGRIYNSGLRKT